MTPSEQLGSTDLATSQVTIAATATSILAAAGQTRRKVTLVNHGTTAVYIGNSSSVSTTTGVLLNGAAGATLTLEYSGALYGIVAAGTQAISVAVIQ